MVSKVDTCEERKQRSRWWGVEWVRAFGATSSPFEEQVERIDAETGASVKFTTLNSSGTIGLILWWWWASVLTIDTLAKQWYFDQIINYGELSWNPNYRHNKIYVQWLLDMMCKNNHPRQWLCLIGWIANFTDIGVLAKAFVDALEERIDELLKHNIHLLVRRGGINETKWLNHIQFFCDKYGIPCIVTDSNVYITDAINELSF